MKNEENDNEELGVPEDCKMEMKSKDPTHLLVAMHGHSLSDLDNIVCTKRYSSAVLIVYSELQLLYSGL